MVIVLLLTLLAVTGLYINERIQKKNVVEKNKKLRKYLRSKK